MQIIIKEKPKVLKRPEVTFRYGKARGYDPSYADKQETLSLLKGKQLQKLSIDCSEGLKIEVIAYMKIPASLSKKKQAELDGQYHIKRPDASNILKYYEDVLEGICYKDDSCLCNVNIKKIYSFEPRVEIEISELV